MPVGSIRPTPPKNADIQRLTQAADKLQPGSQQNSIVENGSSDIVSISNQARNLHDTDKAVKSALDGIPDVRKQKLTEVMKKMESGQYLTDESIGKSVDALIDEKFAQSIREKQLAEMIVDKADKEPDVRDEMVAQAARRKVEKYYDTEPVIKKTVDKLWITPIDRI